MWDETRGRRPEFGDFKRIMLEIFSVLIKEGTTKYEMFNRFITFFASLLSTFFSSPFLGKNGSAEREFFFYFVEMRCDPVAQR